MADEVEGAEIPRGVEALNSALIGLREQRIPTENRIENVKVSLLKKHLFSAASTAAQFALRNYSSSTHFSRVQSAVAAGSAIEYLLRCIILAGDPVLLADKNSVASKLALSRFVNPEATKVKELKTIGADEARALVSLMYKTLFTTGELAKDVLGLRNAAAHMAMATTEDLERDVVKLVQVAGELLFILGSDESEFWGDNLNESVAAMKKSAEDRLKHRVMSKIAAAKQVYEEIIAAFRDDQQHAMLLLLERGDVPLIMDEVYHRDALCPACQRTGQLSLIKEYDFAQFDANVHAGSNQLSELVQVTGVPVRFQCPVCKIRLDDDELSLFPDLREPEELEPVTARMALAEFGDFWDELKGDFTTVHE